MEITKKTARLICDIEHIIGTYCWNDNAAYGAGDYIRYPVWARITQETKDEEGKTIETQEWEKISNINVNNNPQKLSVDDVKTLEYHFGANELVIGKAIIETLEFLEDRYGINFSELEEKY